MKVIESAVSSCDMRITSPTFTPGQARLHHEPLTLRESVRIYFTILFGVAVSLLSFYYLFP